MLVIHIFIIRLINESRTVPCGVVNGGLGANRGCALAFNFLVFLSGRCDCNRVDITDFSTGQATGSIEPDGTVVHRVPVIVSFLRPTDAISTQP